MAEEHEKTSGGGLRFRLPRLFADAAEEGDDSAHSARAEASAAVAAATPSRAAPPIAPPLAAGGTAAPSAELSAEIRDLKDGMEKVYQLVSEFHQRESTQEKVFNTLYAELKDYKNDFIYEHLKPVVRPLLFLYDSLEQFDEELQVVVRPPAEERRQMVSPRLVLDNVVFFREQLVEALRICEVTPMEKPQGKHDPKLHKVIKVVPVDAAQDGTIQQVVRQGWYLNEQLLRPAEVVLGKKQ